MNLQVISGPDGEIVWVSGPRLRRTFPQHRTGLPDVPGLIRKRFIYADDGWAGGVYL